MKNTKINYRWTAKEDKGQPNNGYSEEIEYIIAGEDYSFSDYLDDSGLIGKYEQDGNTYYIIDEDGERTGEAYQITGIETTMTVYGRPITDEDMVNIASYMDDEIREQVHSELAPCSHEEFIKRYLELDKSFADILKREFEFEMTDED